MTEQLTKETLVRLAWLTELRRQGERQCHCTMFGLNGAVCALGLLAEVAGLSKRQTKKVKWTHEIGKLAGLDYGQTCEVWGENDEGGKTFGEIADLVGGWFKK